MEIKGGKLHMTIADNGRGFDLEETVSKYEDGRKLGLRSMRQRVQAAGGDLRILSAPGEGTTLEFVCPLPNIQNESLTGLLAGSPFL